MFNRFKKKDPNILDTKLKKKLLSLAIDIAKYYDITLDFSENSIKEVEKILSLTHKDYLKDKDEKGLLGIALEMAAYIIEVIERKHDIKGRRERNHPQMGEESFPYYYNNETYFPVGWCLKRILDGEGENVWIKYQTFFKAD